MNNIIALLIALLTVTTTGAQNGKDARIKDIRTAYSQAKKKIDQNGKGGKSPKDMRIMLNFLDDEDVPLYTEMTIDYYFDETSPDERSRGINRYISDRNKIDKILPM